MSEVFHSVIQKPGLQKCTKANLSQSNLRNRRYLKYCICSPKCQILIWRTPTLLPAGNYMFKVSNRNTRTRCEICSKLTIKTPERRLWRRSGVFIVNFKHISHLILVFRLLTLSTEMPAGLWTADYNWSSINVHSPKVNFFIWMNVARLVHTDIQLVTYSIAK